MMNSQESDSEKINLIGEGKKLMKLLKTVKLLITVQNHKDEIETYCLKCKKNHKTKTKNINPRVSGTSNGKAMTLSKCVTCGSKKSGFV